MIKFSRSVEIGEDFNNITVFGFSINDMFIVDPYVSECGRFNVDPVETYGISKEDADNLVKLNKILEEAVQREVARKLKPALPDVAVLAKTFSRVLWRCLTAAEMYQVIARNAAGTDPGVCHSHDFCDANTAMEQALQELGVSYTAPTEVTELINEAWDLAKAVDFYDLIPGKED